MARLTSNLAAPFAILKPTCCNGSARNDAAAGAKAMRTEAKKVMNDGWIRKVRN